jgi:pimeloyl-ACP methyl ester carboxylesterase
MWRDDRDEFGAIASSLGESRSSVEVERMATFALIHGGGDVGWYWHLVESELRRRGHDVVAPDLPCDDDSAGLPEYADTVVDAIGDRHDLVVVAQSYGGFTAPLVADRLQVDALVLVAGMIPAPGEAPADWWDNTGYRQAVQEQARRDGGLTGNEDPFIAFYHDVPRALAEKAMRRIPVNADTHNAGKSRCPAAARRNACSCSAVQDRCSSLSIEPSWGA